MVGPVGVTLGNGDRRLSKFASQLMANDYQKRHSQREWHALLVLPLTQDVRKNMKQQNCEEEQTLSLDLYSHRFLDQW